MEIDVPTCRACLGLNYNLFQALDRPRGDGRTLVRYRALPLRILESSAAKGCRYCDVLCQGISLLWQGKLTCDEIMEGSELGICIERRLGECLTLFRYTIGPYQESWQSLVDRSFAELEFYTKKGSDPIHPAFGHANVVPTNLDVARCIMLIRGWLRNCDIYHPSCAATTSKLPRRLINVSGEFPRLVETEGLAFAKYVTLSHCWGKGQHPMKTTKGSIRQRKAGLRWARLPRIFQDAIEITRLIGCDWVWIDSLCIIQDDAFDWNEEALRMFDYYSNSFLNIAATGSLGSSGSLFSERHCWGDYYDNWKELSHDSIELTNKLNGDHMGVFVRSSLNAAHEHISNGHMRGAKSVLVEKAPLLNRAWVFQERLLSPRTVHFCTTEMIWECTSLVTCECAGTDTMSPNHSSQNTEMPTSQPPTSLKGLFSAVCQDGIPEKLALDFWLRAVEQYSRLALTKTSDRPFALAGIAQLISSNINGQYLAGIWASDLPRALLWTSSGFRWLRRCVSPTVPTWSWMYTYGRDNCCDVNYNCLDSAGFKKDHRLKIHSSRTFCNTVGDEQFGTIISGQIVLTAALITAKVCIDDEFYHLTSKDSQSGYAFMDPIHDLDEVRNGDELLCLIVGSAQERGTFCDTREVPNCLTEFALILRPSEGQVGVYERIGVVEFRVLPSARLKGAKKRLVKLV